MKCEAQILAEVNNTRWKEDISSTVDHIKLTGMNLHAYFIEEYQKFNGAIIDNREWYDCVNMIAYCIALGKPMIIYGNTGVGKTTIMQSFGRILSILDNPNHPTFITKRATELVNEFKKGKDINDLYSKPITSGLIKNAGLFIDDIGTENEGVNFGSKSDVIADLILAIEARHEMNYRVSYSTNLSGDDLKSRYGKRVYGRLMKNRTVIIFPESIPDFRIL